MRDITITISLILYCLSGIIFFAVFSLSMLDIALDSLSFLF